MASATVANVLPSQPAGRSIGTDCWFSLPAGIGLELGSAKAAKSIAI